MVLSDLISLGSIPASCYASSKKRGFRSDVDTLITYRFLTAMITDMDRFQAVVYVLVLNFLSGVLHVVRHSI